MKMCAEYRICLKRSKSMMDRFRNGVGPQLWTTKTSKAYWDLKYARHKKSFFYRLQHLSWGQGQNFMSVGHFTKQIKKCQTKLVTSIILSTLLSLRIFSTSKISVNLDKNYLIRLLLLKRIDTNAWSLWAAHLPNNGSVRFHQRSSYNSKID